MATIGKGLADKIKENNGYYADDPRVQRIIEYTNMAGGISYGIEYEWEIGRYCESEFVRDPKIYWRAE